MLGENTQSSADLPSTSGHQPSVQIHNVSTVHPLSVEAALRSITWPADQVHLLKRLDPDSGLFSSPDGKLYAHVENKGHLAHNPDNDGPTAAAERLPGEQPIYLAPDAAALLSPPPADTGWRSLRQTPQNLYRYCRRNRHGA